MIKSFRFFLLYFLVFSLILVTSIFAQNTQGSGKRPLTHDVYDSWESINSPQISVDGEWIVYLETPQKSDVELVVLNPDQNVEYRHVIGYSGEGTKSQEVANPQITYNSSHVIFLISQTKAEVDSVKKEKKDNKKNDKEKPTRKLGVMNLSDGVVTVIDSVKSFKLPEEAMGWVAYLKEEPKKKEKKEDKSEEGKVKGKKEESEKGKKAKK